MIKQRQISPAGEVSFETELVTTATQNPINFPRYRIGPGLQVEIWPRNANVGNAFVATVPNQANAAGGLKKTVPNNAVVAIYYRVENLSELWLGTVNVGDGVTIRVLRGSSFNPPLILLDQSQQGAPSGGGTAPTSTPTSTPTTSPTTTTTTTTTSSGGTSSGSGTPSGSTSGRSGGIALR